MGAHRSKATWPVARRGRDASPLEDLDAEPLIGSEAVAELGSDPAARDRLTAPQVTALQRRVGNGSVVRLLAGGKAPKVQRKKGGPTSAGRLELEGLPPLPITSAEWKATQGTKRLEHGATRVPELEPTKIEVGTLIIRRTPDAGSSAIVDWYQRQVLGGGADARPLGGALHLTRPGKGAALPAGTFEFGEATPLSFSPGSHEKLDLAISGSFRLSGTPNKAAAAAAPARIQLQAPGWDPIPVLSWSLEGGRSEKVDVPVAPSTVKKRKLDTTDPFVLKADVLMGPMVGRLSDQLGKGRILRSELVLSTAKGGTVATLGRALVTGLRFKATPGAQVVSVEFRAEEKK